MKRRIIAAALIIVFVAMGVYSFRLFLSLEKPLPPVVYGDWQSLDNYAAALIAREIAAHNVVGVSVAVVSDQEIIWQQGFGYADKANAVKATPATVYRVGSLSKLINAVAVMQLHDAGRIDIDTSLTEYIPEFTIKRHFTDPSPITLRNILTHHAGLPGDIIGGMWSDNPQPFTEVISLLKDEYAPYPPNYIGAYSNIGADLLGAVVERVSGQNYVHYLDNHVLLPMGMNTASFALKPDIACLLAKGYDKQNQEATDITVRDIPSGGLYASVNDLSKFMMMLFAEGRIFGKEVLSPASAREFFKVQNAGNALDGTSRIGLEFDLDYPVLDYAGKAAGHGGQTYLFYSKMLIVPEHKLAVVVLSNSAAGGHKAVGRIASEIIKAAITVKTGIMPSVTPKADPPYPPGEQISEPTGFYGTLAGLAEVYPKNGHLQMKIRGYDLRLRPAGNDWYHAEYRFGGLIPVPLPQLKNLVISFRNVNGENIIFQRTDARFSAVGKNIAQQPPIPAVWQKRLGQYKLVSKENELIIVQSLILSVRNGFLHVELKSDAESARLVLQPMSENEAVLYALGHRMMETVHFADVNGEECLFFAGLKLVKEN